MVKSEDALDVRTAAKKLDVSEKYLRKLSPKVVAGLVESGMTARRVKALTREKIRFEEFWRSFESLQSKKGYPARRKVEQDVFNRTGIKFRFGEANRYLHRAREIANTALVTRGRKEPQTH
jgi:hypothetical protein